jgi:hypothetical protein
MSRSRVHGIWKHEMVDRGTSTVTIHTIRDDGSYETHMVFAFADGCEQHIHHQGTIEIGDTTLTLDFQSGTTRMTGCTDPSRDFAMRDFTQAEIDETRGLLAQEIPYSMDGDALQMTVKGPMGALTVVYTRQGQ